MSRIVAAMLASVTLPVTNAPASAGGRLSGGEVAVTTGAFDVRRFGNARAISQAAAAVTATPMTLRMLTAPPAISSENRSIELGGGGGGGPSRRSRSMMSSASAVAPAISP